MAGLRALVADLAGGAQGAAVGGGAFAGDVAELAAGIALHGLSLAVTRKVVGATALVAGGRTGVASIAATEATAESTAADAAALRSRAVALVDGQWMLDNGRQYGLDIQQGGRAGCSYSSGRWRRSGAG